MRLNMVKNCLFKKSPFRQMHTSWQFAVRSHLVKFVSVWYRLPRETYFKYRHWEVEIVFKYILSLNTCFHYALATTYEVVDGSLLVVFATSFIASVPVIVCWHICSSSSVESHAFVGWIVNMMVNVVAVVTLQQWWHPQTWMSSLLHCKWLSYWWTSYQMSIAFSSDVKVCIPGFGLSLVQVNVACRCSDGWSGEGNGFLNSNCDVVHCTQLGILDWLCLGMSGALVF